MRMRTESRMKRGKGIAQTVLATNRKVLTRKLNTIQVLIRELNKIPLSLFHS